MNNSINNPSTCDFLTKSRNLWDKDKYVCVGLDTDIKLIPQSLKDQIAASFDPQSEEYTTNLMLSFNIAIIDATAEFACAYKPNFVFYEAEGAAGLVALQKTIAYIHEHHPEIPVISDAKRGDVGNTTEKAVQYILDHMKADAVTLHNYLGKEASMPFLNRKDNGIILLVRTSNPGAGEFQDLIVETPSNEPMPLYQYIAKQVATEWNFNGNCGVVVGATYPHELALVRKIIGPDMPILIPGVGGQGGSIEEVVKASLPEGSKKLHVIINSSRGIIHDIQNPRYALEFAALAHDNAQKMNTEIINCVNKL